MATILSFIGNSIVQSNIEKIFVAVTLVSSLLIIAITPPARGYEISIYDAYPAYLWILISINILFSVSLILRTYYDKQRDGLFGYFSVLLLGSVALFLPIIRGYFAMSRGSGDIFYHLSVAMQIENSGHVLRTNMYPMMHVLLASFQFTSLDLMIMASIISVVFFILYVVSMYALGNILIDQRIGGVLLSVFALPLIFSSAHYAYFPFFFALFLFPLELFIFHKLNINERRKGGYYVCLVILSLFITFCHPLMAILNILMFSIFALFRIVQQWRLASTTLDRVSINVASIVFSTFSLWYFQHIQLINNTEKVLSSVLGESSADTILDNQMSVVSTSDASIWLIVERFIKVYGPTSIYLSVASIFAIYSIIRYIRNRASNSDGMSAIYSIHFIVAIGIGVLFLFKNFIVFEPIRAVAYGLIFATILCGLFLNRLMGTRSWKTVKGRVTPIITIIISAVCIISMLSLYASPWTGEMNPALTFEEKSGVDWTIDNKDINIPIIMEELANTPYITFHNQLLGNNRQDRFFGYTNDIPSGFGYNVSRTIDTSLSFRNPGTVYMTTTEKMKMTPYAVPLERRYRVKSYTDDDFSRLKQDSTVDLIYSNKGYEVWQISNSQLP